MFFHNRFRNLRSYFGAALLLTVLGGSACSLKTPATRTPAPSDQKQDKDFFVRRQVVNGQLQENPRRFQCAWAPISEQGFLGENYLTHAAALNDHCNVEFRIEENSLIAREVNPSVPRRDWRSILTVPITSHFRYERDRDERGRDRNEWIERTNEDDWSRRPQFRLNLTGLQIHKWDYDLLAGAGSQILAVEDVEWSEHNGKKFWAFTATVSSPAFGAEMQAKYRFNFLEFDADPTFTATPYKDENSRYLNVLHILGKRFQSQAPQLFNARWDLSGGDNSIELCLFNWPERQKDVILDTVKEWNDVLAEIGQPRAFWVNTAKRLNYPIDLRCPSMIWVSDPRVIRNSPLGIGLINADVDNGKALWGSIVIYGGAFEHYAKAFTPSDFAASQSDQSPNPWKSVYGNPFRFNRTPAFFVSEQRINSYGSSQMAGDLYRFLVDAEAARDPMFELLETAYSDARGGQASALANLERRLLGDATSPANTERVQGFLANYGRLSNRADRALAYLAFNTGANSNRETVEAYGAGLQRTAGRFQNEVTSIASGEMARSRQMLTERSFANDLLGNYFDQGALSAVDQEMARALSQVSPDQRERAITERVGAMVTRRMRARVWDTDRTFADEAPGWHSLPPELLERKSFPERLRSMLKKTVSHEFGHFLGSGHNFKENILPRDGTVPSKYIDFFKHNVEKYGSALTTVMGYDDGGVMAAVDYDDIKPGPHDKLMMRYIYNRQYPTWNGSDEDFTYKSLPADGRMPEVDADNPEYRTTYFPACNDYHATLALDPYCNRHDRGYDATTLVNGYFDDLDKNWISNTNNFGDASEVPDWAMSRWMWSRSFTSFMRVRHFYDYMIAKYRDPLTRIAVQSDNLYDFYRTCSGQAQNPAIAAILSEPGVDRELIELCKVNGDAITRMAGFLQESGPDFSEIDHDNWFISAGVTGGDAQLNWSHLFGTWSRIGLLPAKYTALLALTSPYPYVSAFSRWLWPITRYARSGPEYKNLYSTFYPEQFTSAISSTVRSNLRFKSEGAESNNMGRSVLALGYFLDDLNYSNEVHRGVDSTYLDNVVRQTRFNVSGETGGYVAIVLNGVKRRGDRAEADRIVGFNATMFDFATREMVPLAVAYVLPDAKIILSSPDQRSFIYPITELKFYKNDAAYAIAIRVTFTEDDKSSLWTRSSKVELRQKYRDVLSSCLQGVEKDGVKNGLTDFFSISNEQEFRGFKTLPDIADSESRFRQFKDSVKEEFEKYLNNPRYVRANNVPNRNACKDALEGIGLVVTSALAIQGWWLPEIRRYIVH